MALNQKWLSYFAFLFSILAVICLLKLSFGEVNFRIASFEMRMVSGGLNLVRLKESSAEVS